MRKILLVISLFLMGQSILMAQQSPVYSQYTVNKFLVNPAVAGGNGYTYVNMAAREQYRGFDNPPRTFALAVQSRLLNDSYIVFKPKLRADASQKSRFTRMGVGGQVFSDRNGIVSKTGVQFSYAYHINFNNEFQWSFGLSLAGFQYKLDDSESFALDPADPVLSGSKKQFWIPDATFGTYISTEKYFAGAAVTDLFGSGIKLGKDPIKDDFFTARYYNLLAGARLPLTADFTIEPSFLMRATNFGFLTDINAKLHYLNQYWMGLSYRTDNTLIAMLGVHVDIFYFGYAYDANFDPINSYTKGGHELMLGLRFGDTSTRRKRWLKEDEVEFEM